MKKDNSSRIYQKNLDKIEKQMGTKVDRNLKFGKEEVKEFAIHKKLMLT